MSQDAGNSHSGYLKPSGHNLKAQVPYRHRLDFRTSLAIYNTQLHSDIPAQRKVTYQSYFKHKRRERNRITCIKICCPGSTIKIANKNLRRNSNTCGLSTLSCSGWQQDRLLRHWPCAQGPPSKLAAQSLPLLISHDSSWFILYSVMPSYSPGLYTFVRTGPSPQKASPHLNLPQQVAALLQDPVTFSKIRSIPPATSSRSCPTLLRYPYCYTQSAHHFPPPAKFVHSILSSLFPLLDCEYLIPFSVRSTMSSTGPAHRSPPQLVGGCKNEWVWPHFRIPPVPKQRKREARRHNLLQRWTQKSYT